MAGGTGAALVGALDVAADAEGLWVDELDVNVFLLDAGEFAVEFVAGFYFFDVEFGLEGFEGGGRSVSAAAVVRVEFVEEAEEWSEGGFGDEGGER